MRPLALVATCLALGTAAFAQPSASPPARPASAASQGQPAATPQDQPIFRGGIDLIEVDVSVVDDRGRPLTDLLVPEFTVTVDGKPRKVVSAEFVSLRGPGVAERRDTMQSSEASVSSNEGRVRGRLILIAIDRDSIGFGRGRNATTAAARFLDRLTTNDRVALVTVPQPGPMVDFTSDHARVRAELERIVGLGRTPKARTMNIGIHEALVITRGNDPRLEAQVYERICAPYKASAMAWADCVSDVRSEAFEIAQRVEEQSRQSTQSLRAILEALREVEGPKSLVWISEGLYVEDGSGELALLDRLAAESNTAVHVVLLDAMLYDVSEPFLSPTVTRDREIQVRGLEMLAGFTRGSLYRVSTGADFVFERLEGELSGYYLLGVESLATDADGKRHGLRVSVARRNATVRARREFRVPLQDGRNQESAEESLVRAMRSPFAATGLPMRVTTYAYRGTDAGKIQVIVAAEFDAEGVADAQELTVGYVVHDASGKVLVDNIQRATLVPREGTGAKVLERLAVLSVEPGTYVLKVAAIDGEGRRGSIDHPLEAWQMSGVPFAVSDLVVGDAPSKPGEQLQPQVEAQLTGDRLAAYMELYAGDPATLEGVAVRLEVATELSGAALDSVAASLGPVDAGQRRTVTAVAPVGGLTPGRYFARAVVARGDKKLWELARPFYVTEASVVAGLASRMPELLNKAAFDSRAVLTPDVLGAAMDVLQRGRPALSATLATVRKGEFTGAARAAFDEGDQMAALFLRGLEFYAAGNLDRAATQLNDALRMSPDFAPASLYYGACFAAGGRDREAVVAWRRASTGKDRLPAAYALTADALARLGDTESLIDLLTQATAERPQDDGLRLRLAQAYAAASRHREALATIDPYLGRHPNDPDALLVALQAIFASRLAGQPVLPDGDAVDRMTVYSRRYAAAKGPHEALVARWVAAMKVPPSAR